LSASTCVRSTSVPDEMKGPKPFVNSATNSGVQVLLLLLLLPPPDADVLDEEAQSKDNGGFLLFSQTCRLIQGYPRDIREYTPGNSSRPHPIPQLIIPTWTCCCAPPLLVTINGPPESPLRHERRMRDERIYIKGVWGGIQQTTIQQRCEQN
jgi:hypothetical protein